MSLFSQARAYGRGIQAPFRLSSRQGLRPPLGFWSSGAALRSLVGPPRLVPPTLGFAVSLALDAW